MKSKTAKNPSLRNAQKRENGKKEMGYTPIKHVRALDMLKCHQEAY